MDKFFFPICYIPFFPFWKGKDNLLYLFCPLSVAFDGWCFICWTHIFFFAKMLDTHIGAVQLVIFISSPLFVAFDDAWSPFCFHVELISHLRLLRREHFKCLISHSYQRGAKQAFKSQKAKIPCWTELYYHSRKGEEKMDILLFCCEYNNNIIEKSGT